MKEQYIKDLKKSLVEMAEIVKDSPTFWKKMSKKFGGEFTTYGKQDYIQSLLKVLSQPPRGISEEDYIFAMTEVQKWAGGYQVINSIVKQASDYFQFLSSLLSEDELKEVTESIQQQKAPTNIDLFKGPKLDVQEKTISKDEILDMFSEGKINKHQLENMLREFAEKQGMKKEAGSNDCGGFQKPKGHLDTQMYPECENTPCDRDIVKKEEKRRKKNQRKKNAFNLKEYRFATKEIKLRELYRQFLEEGKSKESAATELLDILTDGEFVSVEEPKRSELIQKVIEKYSKTENKNIKKEADIKEMYPKNYEGIEANFLKPQTYEYYINLDERGEFYADVRNSNGKTIWETHGFDVFEDGWMKHKNDLDGLKEYLVFLGIMNKNQNLKKGN